MPQFRIVAAGQHGRNVKEIINDARAFIKLAIRNNVIPVNLADGNYGDMEINGRTYRFCVRTWHDVPNDQKGSRTSGFKSNPDSDDIVIHCTVNNAIVTGIYHVVLNDTDKKQWRTNSQEFIKGILRDMTG